MEVHYYEHIYLNNDTIINKHFRSILKMKIFKLKMSLNDSGRFNP